MGEMNITYTYGELNREKSLLLLTNFVREMVLQNANEHKIYEDGRCLSVSDVQDLYEDKLASMDAESYDKLITTIMDNIRDKIL
ncbi:hypothetical protein HMPREF0401_01621 [Fusobacterium animalis 11_3_2]|uniref:Uncharacterized protein n=1 Tax=Fusobacterium animalis 11_3_2 TaxID=457403 RepID=F7L1A0_9FUSO|nr:hypothetical protein [Fusobacterium animalis]EGN66652.1 hypothetical protein HMPREF0401_01621 [Fusobacterium animalis 11_3_2]